jgi:hypothetical protein
MRHDRSRACLVPAPLRSNEGPPNSGSSERAKREAMNDLGTRMAALQQFPFMADAIWARPCSIGSSSNSGSTWRFSTAYGSPARSGFSGAIPDSPEHHGACLLGSFGGYAFGAPARETDRLLAQGMPDCANRFRLQAARWERALFHLSTWLRSRTTVVLLGSSFVRGSWSLVAHWHSTLSMVRAGRGRGRYSYRSASMGSISAAFIAG